MKSANNAALPNFLCVGAQKAGTTTIYSILKQHPDVFLSDTKEGQFFNSSRYDAGISYYQKLFRDYAGQKIIGDISPEYMFHREGAKRIKKTLGGGIKILFLFRHPVDRAYSHYQMLCRNGKENRTFKELIEDESKVFYKGDIFRRGFYAEQVTRFLEYFPREQLHFVKFEDLVTSRETVICDILNFLSIRRITLNTEVHANKTLKNKYPWVRNLYGPRLSGIRNWVLKRRSLKEFLKNRLLTAPDKLNPQLREQLIPLYVSDINELERITKMSFSNWLMRSAG